MCLNEIKDRKLLTAGECYGRKTSSSINDLTNPMRIFGNIVRGFFCLATAKDQDTAFRYLADELTIGSAQKAKQLVLENSLQTQTAQPTPSLPSKGYLPNQNLQGYINQPS